MVICLEQGTDLHMAQLMPLPLAVSCFSKIQIGFTFLVPAHPGSPNNWTVFDNSATVSGMKVCDVKSFQILSKKCIKRDVKFK